jgi:flagellar biosynthesis/type III secretory pathway protein FliH
VNLNSAKTFAFPARNNLDARECEATQARDAQLAAAFAEADARGHADGLARGREEAKTEARELLETSYQDGITRGQAAGLAEMKLAAESLGDALRNFELERANLLAEAEAFCADLALAIVARLVEADKVRAEFIHRTTQLALKVLAPEAPTAVFLNPVDCKAAAKAMRDLPLREDATLAPGTARVEAGRLLVESSLDEAFAQVRSAVLETKLKRTAKKSPAQSSTPGTDAATDTEASNAV